MAQNCSCQSGDYLIFSCSGAADVGALSDRCARTLMKENIGKMFCLAGIGGRVPGIMATAEKAKGMLAIDGCPLDCVKSTLKTAGFEAFDHIRITDHGFEKGKTELNAETVNKVVELCKTKASAV